MQDFIIIADAVCIASQISAKQIEKHNIVYLAKYAKIASIKKDNLLLVSKSELENYYKCQLKGTQSRSKYGDDIDWNLSFSNLREKDTTKHVHRLHPYKGKFIPQLVEYFIKRYFTPGEIVLDPFSGSGTMLVQAHEMGMHAIGVDISKFNCLLTKAKLNFCDTTTLDEASKNIQQKIAIHHNQYVQEYLNTLDIITSEYNKRLTAPVIKARSQELGAANYIKKVFAEYQTKYSEVKAFYNLEDRGMLPQNSGNFIETWYFNNVQHEMIAALEAINKIQDESLREMLTVILSRTIRSCRATTHSDLATLLKPQTEPYYCSKHYKICYPVMTISKMFSRYAKDTSRRLAEFAKIRTKALSAVIEADSRDVDIYSHLNSEFLDLLNGKKIDGIFSSPPYLGQIDYHEQHAYAYDLFGFPRNDESEIGPLFRGQGKQAQESYIAGISAVLNNSKKYLKEGYNIFLVANDKHSLYPEIAKRAGMNIVNTFRRPVLNRTEKDRSNAYAESIFHMRGDCGL